MRVYDQVQRFRTYADGVPFSRREDGVIVPVGLALKGPMRFLADYSVMSGHFRRYVDRARDLARETQATYLACAYVMGTYVADGVRVYEPSADDAAALEEIELNIPLSDVQLPFPAFAVQMPLSFSRARQVTENILNVNRRSDDAPNGEAVTSPIHPDFVILHRDGDILYAMIYGTRPHDRVRDGLPDEVMRLVPLGASSITAPTVEEQLHLAAKDVDLNIDGVSTQTANNGPSLIITALRVAMNAVLLLTGNAQPDASRNDTPGRRRLVERLAHAEKRGFADHAARTAADLAALPTYYTLAQQITVRASVGDARATEPGGPTGRRVRPHWRRAHWRRQPCGVGGRERRPTLIPHTLIHREQFGGRAGDTSVTYRPPT